MEKINTELNELLTYSIHNDNILRSQYKRAFNVNLIKKMSTSYLAFITFIFCFLS